MAAMRASVFGMWSLSVAIRWPTSKSVAVGFDANEAYAAVGKFENLRRARVVNQLFDEGADELLRTDAHIDGNRILFEQLVCVHVLGRANARNLGWRTELRVRNLAGDHVGFVGVGECDDDVGVRGAGAFKHFGIGRMSDDGADVEPVLQLAKYIGSFVDDGDFVGLFA